MTNESVERLNRAKVLSMQIICLLMKAIKINLMLSGEISFIYLFVSKNVPTELRAEQKLTCCVL